jgi:outer membrane receptor protein involved in Fe transport
MLSFSHANTVKRFGYFTNFTRRASDGWRQSSAYDNVSAFGKFKYDYSPTNGITFTTLYLSGENDYPHSWASSLEPLRVRDIYTNDSKRKQTLSTDLHYRRVESASEAYSLRFFYNRDLTRSLLNPADDPRDNDVAINFQTRSVSQKFGFQDQNTRQLPYNNTLVFGVETIWDLVDGAPESHLYGQQQAFSAAVFAQNDYQPVEKLHIIAGARYDTRHVNGGRDTRQFSPKAGLSYAFFENFVGRATVGRAFRNPSIAEMFLKKVGTQDYEFVPNPDLNPETVNFGEAGLSFWLGDRVMLDGAVFRYDYQDMIRWQVLSAGRYRTENLSSATIQGFEAGVKTAHLPPLHSSRLWPRWNIILRTSTTLTYLDTDIDNAGPLTYTPKWRFKESISMDYQKLSVSADMRAVAKTDTVIFYQNDAPDAYTIFDVRCTLQFHPNARIGFIVENVADVQYEEMERYRMPPRTFRVDLNYEIDR